jgi:hypothetical protein
MAGAMTQNPFRRSVIQYNQDGTPVGQAGWNRLQHPRSLVALWTEKAKRVDCNRRGRCFQHPRLTGEMRGRDERRTTGRD